MALDQFIRVDEIPFAEVVEDIFVETERAKIKVENFECDINRLGFGTVTIDGKPVTVRGFDLRIRAGAMSEIRLDLSMMGKFFKS